MPPPAVHARAMPATPPPIAFPSPAELAENEYLIIANLDAQDHGRVAECMMARIDMITAPLLARIAALEEQVVTRVVPRPYCCCGHMVVGDTCPKCGAPVSATADYTWRTRLQSHGQTLADAWANGPVTAPPASDEPGPVRATTSIPVPTTADYTEAIRSHEAHLASIKTMDEWKGFRKLEPGETLADAFPASL